MPRFSNFVPQGVIPAILLPFKSDAEAMTATRLEEERRLMYVGITRAKRQATISHAANRRIYGQWTSSIPSRFVGELPEDAVAVTNTMQGGASLWRAALSASDPFADVTRGAGRGPGWACCSASTARAA